MKHVMYGAKALLMDDETAALLLEYAGEIAASGGGDTVVVRAVSSDGNDVDVTILLNSSTELIAESTRSVMTPPRNVDAIGYLRDRIQRLRHPPNAHPVLDGDDSAMDESA